MKTIVSKSGKQITLRPLKPSDLTTLFDWVKKLEKEDTYILLNPKEPISLKQEKNYLKSTIKDVKDKQKVQLGAFYKDQYIGSCEITKFGKRQGHVGRFGIALDKDYRSEGIGLKLAEHVVSLAQKNLGTIQVVLNCFDNNIIGINFYKKLGFVQYGLHPQAISYQGKLVDEILFCKNVK